ncbi:MAG TPA: hypothetical protein VGI32_18760 [Steroidobacteraceae bacterium]|jgi:hypothetical protein
MGPLAKAFVKENRKFGVSSIVGGIIFIGVAVDRLAKGQADLLKFAILAGSGIAFVLFGILYLKAPLSRKSQTGE